MQLFSYAVRAGLRFFGKGYMVPKTEELKN